MTRPHAFSGILLGAWLSLAAAPASAQDFWDDLAGTSGSGAWVTYPHADPQLELKVFERINAGLSGDRDPAAVRLELLELGPPTVPLLFAMLSGELEYEAGEDPDEEGVLGDANRPSLDGLIYDALASLPADAVIDHLEVAATGEAPTEIRLLAARVLSRNTAPGALEVLLDVVTGIEPVQLQAQHLRRALTEAFTAVLERHPTSLRGLPEQLQDVDTEVVELITQALSADLAREGIPFVLDLFSRDGELDLALMRSMAQLARSPQAAGNLWEGRDCLLTVRLHLRSEDWRMRRESMVAAVQLHDIKSLETLVALLEDEHRSVQATALWALRNLTAQQYEADPARWHAWITAERAWFDGPRADAEWGICSGQDELVIAGIRELLQHPLFRDSTADLLGPLLQDSPAGVFACARMALVHLASTRAVPYLVGCLDDAEEDRRSSSWSALKSLTALDLPPQRQAWADELGI